MRILGGAGGDRRRGAAVRDELGPTAQPVETYTRKGYGPDVRHFGELAERYGTRLFLCGLPRNMDGSVGGQAKRVREFAAQLEAAGYTVRYQDERMTTVSAQRALLEADMRRDKRKQKVDMVAAVIILQAYLDAGGLTQSIQMKGEEEIMDDQERLNEVNEELEEEMEEDDIVELIDEDGQSVRFEHLMTLEHEGELYVMLTALEATPDTDEDEVFILRIEKDAQGEDCYVTVDDENILQAVFEKFVRLSEADEQE